VTRVLSLLRRDTRGATLVEFALVAPVLGLLLVGAYDMGHTLYMKTVLQGIMQKTARDSGLESGLGADQAIDAKVTSQVKALANNADITFSRRFYRTFSDAAAANAEPFTDANDGQGGAKDSVLYTVTVEYPRMFPMNAMMGFSDIATVKGAMILANQPYGDQGSYAAPVVRNCS
jgi:Flp pilus assembly protein TadG